MRGQPTLRLEKATTRKRLRSAYRSLKTNSKWLFTWYDHYVVGNTQYCTSCAIPVKSGLRNRMLPVKQVKEAELLIGIP